MQIQYFNTLWTLKVFSLQRMSDKMNMEKSNDMENSQEYNYYKEFNKIVYNLLRNSLKKENKRVISSSNISDEQRAAFSRLDNNIDNEIYKWYKILAEKTWFCCFYERNAEDYPNASILEAFGGVFCGIPKDELIKYCGKLNEKFSESKIYDLYFGNVYYTNDAEAYAVNQKKHFKTIFYSTQSKNAGLRYNAKEKEYIPTDETWKTLQEIFISLSYGKENSLDNEHEFRISVVKNITEKNYREKSAFRIARLIFHDGLITDLLVLKKYCKTFDSCYYSDDEVHTLNDFDFLRDNEVTNMLYDIIGKDKYVSEKTEFGGSYYRHFKLKDTIGVKTKEVQYGGNE